VGKGALFARRAHRQNTPVRQGGHGAKSASAHPTDFAGCSIFNTTGKSLFRLSEMTAFVQLELKKYFQNICCTAGQITSINHPILTRQEGRYANVSNVGQVAVDVGGFIDD
jgi:hypothetical protein